MPLISSNYLTVSASECLKADGFDFDEVRLAALQVPVFLRTPPSLFTVSFCLGFDCDHAAVSIIVVRTIDVAP